MTVMPLLRATFSSVYSWSMMSLYFLSMYLPLHLERRRDLVVVDGEVARQQREAADLLLPVEVLVEAIDLVLDELPHSVVADQLVARVVNCTPSAVASRSSFSKFGTMQRRRGTCGGRR